MISQKHRWAPPIPILLHRTRACKIAMQKRDMTCKREFYFISFGVRVYLDEVGGLVSVGEFVILRNVVSSAGRVQNLIFCEKPSSLSRLSTVAASENKKKSAGTP